MKYHIKLSHIICSLFLIAVGIVVLYFLVSAYLEDRNPMFFLSAILVLPLGIVLPLYSGLALLIDDVKKAIKGESSSNEKESD